MRTQWACYLTGALTGRQFDELQLRVHRFNDTPIYLGISEIKIYGYDGYATVEGTWIIEGERIAYPINQVKIKCTREHQECVIFEVDIDVPKIGEGGEASRLNMSTKAYSIISWSGGEIVARDSGNCRTALLNLNLNSHEVYETVGNNRTKACGGPISTLPKLESPRITRLVPGFKRSYDFWRERRKLASEYLNPRYRKKSIRHAAFAQAWLCFARPNKARDNSWSNKICFPQ